MADCSSSHLVLLCARTNGTRNDKTYAEQMWKLFTHVARCARTHNSKHTNEKYIIHLTLWTNCEFDANASVRDISNKNYDASMQVDDISFLLAADKWKTIYRIRILWILCISNDREREIEVMAKQRKYPWHHITLCPISQDIEFEFQLSAAANVGIEEKEWNKWHLMAFKLLYNTKTRMSTEIDQNIVNSIHNNGAIILSANRIYDYFLCAVKRLQF